MLKRIEHAGVVEAPVDNVFLFLKDVRRHHLLAGHRIQVEELWQDAAGEMAGALVLRGPFGLRRRVATREILRESDSLILGVATTDSRSMAVVSWDLTAIDEARTHVALSARIVELSPADHLLLMIGGHRSLTDLFGETLRRLASQLSVALTPV